MKAVFQVFMGKALRRPMFTNGQNLPSSELLTSAHPMRWWNGQQTAVFSENSPVRQIAQHGVWEHVLPKQSAYSCISVLPHTDQGTSGWLHFPSLCFSFCIYNYISTHI